MPIFKKGNVFNSGADVTIVTTNGAINARNELVMGRGAALEAKNRYPELAQAFANHIKTNGKYIKHRKGYLYHFVIMGLANTMIGAFQVKYHWKEDADLSLIAVSAEVLKSTAENSNLLFAMNYPGIGNGRLIRNDVAPILEVLPDNVHIYEL